MTPDKSQPSTTQADQSANEPVSNQQPSQQRPDWIIPDNGISSRRNGRQEEQPNSQQDDNSIPLDNDETLGIP